MKKACGRCGVVSDVEISPTAACPACGAVYAKVDQLSDAQRAALKPRQTRSASTAQAATSFGQVVERLLWVLGIFGCFAAIVQVTLTMDTAKSAPQQAAGMAMALAYAVIPYVLARCAQEFRRR